MRNLNSYFNSDEFIQVYKHYGISKEDREIVEEILNLEWDFFDKVKGLDGRAQCQDDTKNFIVMRLSQHLVFSPETRKSIRDDYKNYLNDGINPIEGKYAMMMEYTDEEKYFQLLDKLPRISPIKRHLIMEIVNEFEGFLRGIEEKYPVTASRSRPTINKGHSISSLSYFYAELSYFSYRSLRKMKLDIVENRNKNFVEEIYTNTVIISKYIF